MNTERSTSSDYIPLSAATYKWCLSVNIPGYLPDSDPDCFRATVAEARERFADEYTFQTGGDPESVQRAEMYAGLPGGYVLVCERIC